MNLIFRAASIALSVKPSGRPWTTPSRHPCGISALRCLPCYLRRLSANATRKACRTAEESFASSEAGQRRAPLAWRIVTSRARRASGHSLAPGRPRIVGRRATRSGALASVRRAAGGSEDFAGDVRRPRARPGRTRPPAQFEIRTHGGSSSSAASAEPAGRESEGDPEPVHPPRRPAARS